MKCARSKTGPRRNLVVTVVSAARENGGAESKERLGDAGRGQAAATAAEEPPNAELSPALVPRGVASTAKLLTLNLHTERSRAAPLSPSDLRHGSHHVGVFQRYDDGVLHHLNRLDRRPIRRHLLPYVHHEAPLAEAGVIAGAAPGADDCRNALKEDALRGPDGWNAAQGNIHREAHALRPRSGAVLFDFHIYPKRKETTWHC
ncbi:Protein of unknown function [Gryllus bimaculatus]|nr:Protein of unknown function [Gryllus bimaculatus]